MNADKLEAYHSEAASTDEYGDEQEGNETVVRPNQRNQAETLEPKGTGERSASFPATDTHPQVARRNLPPYVHRQTGIRNEVTLHELSAQETSGAGANRKACGEGSLKKQRPGVTPRIG